MRNHFNELRREALKTASFASNGTVTVTQNTTQAGMSIQRSVSICANHPYDWLVNPKDEPKEQEEPFNEDACAVATIAKKYIGDQINKYNLARVETPVKYLEDLKKVSKFLRTPVAFSDPTHRLYLFVGEDGAIKYNHKGEKYKEYYKKVCVKFRGCDEKWQVHIDGKWFDLTGKVAIYQDAPDGSTFVTLENKVCPDSFYADGLS